MFDGLITILGPTASGKTDLAASLAYRLGGEVISGDSRQIYRGMDIGTGKDLEDYTVDGTPISYHLIDIREPGYRYNVYEYQSDFLQVYQKLKAADTPTILCGGSGLYLEAILKGYKLVEVPENPSLRRALQNKSLDELTRILESYKQLHNTTDVDTATRAIRAIEIEEFYRENQIDKRPFPEIPYKAFGIYIGREQRRANITARLDKRLQSGLVEEVRGLLDKPGIHPEDLTYYGLEYKYVTQYVMGETTYEDMRNLLEIAIHQFAKRQMTWFRGMEKRGVKIDWIDYEMPKAEKVDYLCAALGA